MRTLRVSLFAVAIAVLVLALPGCYLPSPPSTPPPPAPATTLHVSSSCDLGDDIIDVMPGDLVRFCNDNSCLVTIVFESRELFGRESLRLDPGECVNLHVRKGAANHTYVLDLDCESCGSGGGHTTPEMKVGGGGP